MAMQYWLVRNRLTRADSDMSLRGAVLKAHPMTTSGLLTFTAEHRTTIREARATVRSDGTLLSDDGVTTALKIPRGADQGDPLWRLTLEFEETTGIRGVELGAYPITADEWLDVILKDGITQTAVTPTTLTQVAQLVARAETAAQRAEDAETDDVDLTGYATESYVQQAITNAGGTGGSGSGLALDTDGVPYVTTDAGTPGSSVALDTDGVPYLTIGA